jgi:hypothetical protein
VFGFPLLGLAVAGVCYAFAALHDYSKPWTGLDSALTLLSVIVCPPQLILAFCIDCEVIGWDGFVQYAVIGFFGSSILRSTQQSEQWSPVCRRNQNEPLDEYQALLCW